MVVTLLLFKTSRGVLTASVHRISTLLSIDVIVSVVHSAKTKLLKPITLISSGTAIELFIKPFTAPNESM